MPCSANSSRAAVRMRSRLARASFRSFVGAILVFITATISRFEGLDKEPEFRLLLGQPEQELRFRPIRGTSPMPRLAPPPQTSLFQRWGAFVARRKWPV